MMLTSRVQILSAFFLLLATLGNSQQNHSLYFMHQVPESNLLNPAVPLSCKWYVGLPVLSSTHLNYANSALTFRQLFPKSETGAYIADIDGLVKQLRWRNYIGTEIHTQLFALGYRPGDYSFMFSVTEKNNLSLIVPKKIVRLLWGGNTQFEGESTGLKGTGVYFNHYREYALSVSKFSGSGVYFGARAKLLFGKLNVATRNTSIDLFTDPTSFNLNFTGDLLAHSSLPLVIDTTGDILDNVSYNEEVNIPDLILNRKNPGFGIDLGIIYPYSNNLELSASIIDLGFIRWRSNLNSMEGEGSFFYDGPWGDTVNTESYLRDIAGNLRDSLDLTISQTNYTSFLPARLIGGVKYHYSNKLSFGLQGEALFYRTKIIPSTTISAMYNPFDYLGLMASYSIQYYSLKSVGAGIVLGRNPVQFYILSDNVPGMIWPLSARNINLRFGLNILFGCKDKIGSPGSSGMGMLPGNCAWAEEQLQKKIRRKKNK
ncbi:MAG: hypothetical protein JXA77_12815 [Bacteroidales bacterium]|nr:hypothetical protein [Bacteroidales bacterium]MBN2820474.1 hypothetical protein [Bacteroidales bacterium]